ncbi:hypothetical protein PFISCL1PPCAC_3079, partial [Pristionchus fissidentatus]
SSRDGVRLRQSARPAKSRDRFLPPRPALDARLASASDRLSRRQATARPRARLRRPPHAPDERSIVGRRRRGKNPSHDLR